jgi:hypothetical protein
MPSFAEVVPMYVALLAKSIAIPPTLSGRIAVTLRPRSTHHMAETGERAQGFTLIVQT